MENNKPPISNIHGMLIKIGSLTKNPIFEDELVTFLEQYGYNKAERIYQSVPNKTGVVTSIVLKGGNITVPVQKKNRIIT